MHGPMSSDRSLKLRSEELDQTPNTIYSCGILFPQETIIQEYEDESSIDEDDIISDTDENNQATQTRQNVRDREPISENDNHFDDLNLASQLKPSSISLSFRVCKTKKISFRLNYGIYKKIKDTQADKSSVLNEYNEYKGFIEWWKNNSDLAYKTMKNYLGALKILSEDLKQQQISQDNLSNITNPEILSDLSNRYFSIQENNAYNQEKHNRFSATFSQYIKYRSETQDNNLKI